ncbi:unnamed protein product [Paramecium primaurelia]|uniref:Transmembrane protein n=1 Tax=Paramecium primaurelia TaxID=5886 RepID=A0A8S1KJ24_PARPR|nr:unnamed protein product [Paramecium primaurelia]
MLILYLFFYGCFLLMTYLQYQSQNKITMSKYKFKRLHILMSLGIECAVLLGCSILFINLGLFNKQSSAWSAQVHRNYNLSFLIQIINKQQFIKEKQKIHGSFSKAAHKQKQIGNFQWLSGDLVTLEVSEGVQSGQIIKGVQIDQLICQDMQIMMI